MVPITPLADYVVAKQEAAQTKTASGLLLPDNAADKPKIAKVLSTGPAARDVVEGDRIIFGGYNNTDITVEGVEYVLIKSENIYAKLENQQA